MAVPGEALLFVPARSQCDETPLTVSDDFAYIGHAVDVYGSRAVVSALGAPVANGSVYVFDRIGGTWTEQVRLYPSDGIAGDRFGTAIAVQGDRFVVGAPEHNAVADHGGQAYVFAWDGNQWIEEAILSPGDQEPFDRFGLSAAIDGDFVVVGSEDAAYVYRFDGVAWNLDATLAGDGIDSFGAAAAIAGDRIAVGAPKRTHSSAIRPGAVFVYAFEGAAWNLEQELHADPVRSIADFGASLEFDAGRLLVGAPGSLYAGVRAGEAFLFEPDGVAFDQVQRIQGSSSAQGDTFGTRVALEGDTLCVSAPQHDGFQSSGGAVYLFHSDGSSFVESHRFVPTTTTPVSFIGAALALSEGTLLVDAETNVVRAYQVLEHPSSSLSYGSGTPGTLGVPTLAALGNPSLGNELTLAIGNSAGNSTSATLYVGLQSSNLPGFGGVLLVSPILRVPLLVPAPGMELAAGVPCDGFADGFSLFLQVLEVDPGAPAGISFSAGLELQLGY
jgi:hypothetical protein